MKRLCSAGSRRYRSRSLRRSRRGRDPARLQSGRRRVDGSALAQREPAAQLHRQRLRVADRARQEDGPRPGAGHQVDADQPDGLALRPAPGRQIPRRHAVHRRRRRVHLQARRRRRLGHEGLHQPDQGSAQGRRSRRRDRDHGAVSDPARHADDAGDDEQEMVRGQQGRAPGRPPQGHREHRQLQGQRHRPVPPEGAPALGADRAGEELQLVGQAREQRRRDRVHADRQRRDPRRGAAVRRDRRDGAGAAAGRRAHQVGRHFNVLQGPELRTIFLGMDQKRDELQFSSVKGKNPFKDVRVRRAFYQAIDVETIKSARHARRRAADRPDGRLRRARLSARHEQAPAVRRRGGQEAARRGRLSERLRGRR